MKKEYKPIYYQKFSCISSECKHSCCKLWEIDIDEYSLDNYENNYPEIFSSVLISEENDETEYRFKMDNRKSCVHLKENGLCSLICQYGEDIIPDNCFQHPRFVNEFPGRIEYGMGLCCEEVARLVLDLDFPFEFIEEFNHDIHDICPEEDTETEKGQYEIFGLFDAERRKLLEDSYKENYDIGNFLLRYDNNTVYNILTKCETLDENWNEYVSYLKENPAERITEYDELFRKLLRYYIYRFEYDMVADRMKTFASFALSTVYGIVSGMKRRNARVDKKQIFEICREFSAEIEYSTINPDIVFNALIK